jgi:predicted metalloprotease with PDZ domain
MKQIIGIVSLVFLIYAYTFAAPGKTYRLNYTFTKKSNDTIQVTLQFQNFAKDIHSVLLPSEYAGQNELYKTITNIRTSKNISLVSTNRPDSFIVKHANKKEFTITYDLHQDFTESLKHPLYFRPIIQKELFYISGYCGLIYPGLESNSRIHCTVDYVNFPAEALTGNSFFNNATHQSFVTTLEEIRNAFYFAGNMRFKEFTSSGSKLVIALYGKYAFSDEDLFANITQLVSEQRRFWKDTLHPYFIITLLPVESQTSGGTAYHNSFSIFYNQKFKLGDALQYLIAHEYFHTWIGQKMQQMQPEEMGKWFTEGFTEYYSFKMLLKTGIITEDEYLNKVNDVLKKYYLSPFVASKNEEMVARYFTDMNVNRLAYNRGMIIAMILNNEIEKNKKGSLDQFMLDYYTQLPDPKTFDEQRFFTVLKNYVSEDIIQIVKDINQGKNEALQAHLAMANYQAEQREIMDFELGFDLAESRKNKKVTGLVPGSAAAAAGLKEDQKLDGGMSIYGGDPDKPAKIGIIEDGQRRVIQYFPAKKTGMTGVFFKKSK